MKRKTAKSTLIILIFIIPAFLFVSCKKDEIDWNKLPDETQNGYNDLGCFM